MSDNSTIVAASETESVIADSQNLTAISDSSNVSAVVSSANSTQIQGADPMGVFNLKYRDTLRVMDVALKNPDDTARDLTANTGINLHVLLNDGSIYTVAMTVVGAATAGNVRYTWSAVDWDPGNLIVGPTPPLTPSQTEHRFEIEVLGPGADDRETFPNTTYDTLRVINDIGQS